MDDLIHDFFVEYARHVGLLHIFETLNFMPHIGFYGNGPDILLIFLQASGDTDSSAGCP